MLSQRDIGTRDRKNPNAVDGDSIGGILRLFSVSGSVAGEEV